MKPLTRADLENLVEHLQTLVGAYLQDVRPSVTGINLGFYKRDLSWVYIDLTSALPMLLLPDSPLNLIKKPKPITLFIKAHLLGKKLLAVTLAENRERILFFKFENDGSIETRLFPHGQNMIATDGAAKSISVFKVLDLGTSVRAQNENDLGRSPAELLKQWAPGIKKENKKIDLFHQIEKKERALLKMKEDLNNKLKFNKWKSIGEKLKEIQSIKLSDEFSEYIDTKLSLAENIQNCFLQDQLIKAKLQSSKNRIEKVEKEIEKLKSGERVPLKTSENKISKAEAIKTRVKYLDNNLVAYLGRSAKDNLLLLRQAKPWDLWLHLKDRPGSHAIIRRPRNFLVSDSVLTEVVRWLSDGSSKGRFSKGDTVEALVSEARFVRPVKGDKLGRVTVSESRVLRIKY